MMVVRVAYCQVTDISADVAKNLLRGEIMYGIKGMGKGM